MRLGNSKRSTAIVLTVFFGLLLAGCRDKTDVLAEAPVDLSRSWEYERGPISLVITVDREEMNIAERLELVFDVELADTYELTMPMLSPETTQFAVADIIDGKQFLLDDGGIGYSRTYVLEPFLSGEYTIPELPFLFRKRDDIEDAHELVSEAITIQINSLLPEDMAELVLRDVTGPVAPESTRLRILIWSGAGLIGLAGLTIFVLQRNRKRKRREAIEYVAAHEAAFDALDSLIAEDLLSRDEIELFYVRVSGILRHYIENRFGIHAPEQTTEEFLAATRVGESLSDVHREMLDRFLTHCDLVKFAELTPAAEEIQTTFDACRDFIESTRDDGVKIPASVGA